MPLDWLILLPSLTPPPQLFLLGITSQIYLSQHLPLRAQGKESRALSPGQTDPGTDGYTLPRQNVLWGQGAANEAAEPKALSRVMAAVPEHWSRGGLARQAQVQIPAAPLTSRAISAGE